MAWFRQKLDPISDRARSLNEEIAELESEIKKLDARLQRDHSAPRLRSTALSHGSSVHHLAADEPIFEEVDQGRLKTQTEPDAKEQSPELGVRKNDGPTFWQRLRNQFRGPSTTNPKLVSYLAAGGIQGLRPMRYEKRVARNRFLALVIILFLTLLGIIAVFVNHH